MIGRAVRSFKDDESGAIGPLYAVAILTLVAMAGIGFDYGRVMALDTELQNAADQAALAAATQLDGREGAMVRARNAANNTFATATSNYVNQTRFANDGSGRPITSLSFKFYEDYEDDAPVDEVTDDDDGENAHVVEVTVNPRALNYALTPLVGAIRDDAIGRAMATIENASCNVTPLMVCAPSTDFPTGYEGHGVLMEPGPNVGFWEPGVFGYLDLVGGGANGLRNLLGSNGVQDACVSNDNMVEAKEGNTTSAARALNTRFDIYEGGLSCEDDGTFCPVEDTRKDQVREEKWEYKNRDAGDIPARPPCSVTAADSSSGSDPKVTVGGWQSLPSGSLPSSSALQGFPRDTCHYSSCTGGKYGDGTWNRAGYLAAMPFGDSVPDSLTTRYQIYEWELQNTDPALDPVLANSGDSYTESCTGSGGKCTYTWTNYCAYPAPIYEAAPTRPKDGRVLTVAAVDCAGSASNHKFPIISFVDMFLVEPSLNRSSPSTSQSQIYGEVIGPATRPGGGSGFQYYGRRKAVLIR